MKEDYRVLLIHYDRRSTFTYMYITLTVLHMYFHHSNLYTACLMSLLIHSIHQFECFIHLPITFNPILQFIKKRSSVSLHLQDEENEFVILIIYTQSRWTNKQTICQSLKNTEWSSMLCVDLQVFTLQPFKCPRKIREIQAITRHNLYLNEGLYQ